MKYGTRLFVLVVVLLLVPFSAAAGGPVHEYLLDNGLKVLVRPDRRAPIVVSEVWYRVGSSYEYGGITGVSHALEHMMFKGTKQHPPGEFSRIIAGLGGRENAFTSRDYTAYFQLLPARQLETALRLEADRMRNLTLPKAEFEREIAVVREERRLRIEDNPNGLTWEHFNATAWLNSPNGIPVIGWMSDLENMTVDDLRAWYRTWYAPDNATLVVVGDVDPDAVYRLARRYFGGVVKGDRLHPKPRAETPQRGERRIVVKAPAETPWFVMGYKVPSLLTAAEDWEPYALEILAGIFDGGASARLPSRLVRGSEIAASAGASYSLIDRLETLFIFDAVPAPGRDIGAVEAALEAEIERVQREPVEPAELERVKAQVVASDVYQRDSQYYRAMLLGMAESVGLGWRELENYVERIRAVTPEQVQAVAQKYLVADRRTVAVLDPQPIDPDNPPSSFEGHLR